MQDGSRGSRDLVQNLGAGEAFVARPSFHAQDKHTIIVQFALGLLAGAERSRLAPQSLLESIGVGPEMQASPLARIPLDDLSALLRRLSRVLRDEGLALYGRPLRPGFLASTIRQMVRCTTLGEALHTAAALWRGSVEDFRIRIHVAGPRTRIVLIQHKSQPVLAAAHSVFLYCLISLCCWLIQRPIPLQSFTVAAPGSGKFGQEGPKLFEVPIRFDQPYSSVEFAAGYLACPILADAQGLLQFLAGAPASLLLPFRAPSGLIGQVRQRLRRQLGGELPSLDDMADALEISSQKLRRVLHEEGSGYQLLKNDLRRDMAIEHLVQTNLSLSEIGERLGFTEPSAFQRAFKRWTGVAPGEYRGERRAIDSSTIRKLFSIRSAVGRAR